jgi:hypothetical protein
VTIRRKSGRPSSEPPIPKAYTKKFPISAPNFKDLFILCEKLMIPREHHPYYDGLKIEETVRDELPGPNYYETDEDSTDVL